MKSSISLWGFVLLTVTFYGLAYSSNSDEQLIDDDKFSKNLTESPRNHSGKTTVCSQEIQKAGFLNNNQPVPLDQRIHIPSSCYKFDRTNCKPIILHSRLFRNGLAAILKKAPPHFKCNHSPTCKLKNSSDKNDSNSSRTVGNGFTPPNNQVRKNTSENEHQNIHKNIPIKNQLGLKRLSSFLSIDPVKRFKTSTITEGIPSQNNDRTKQEFTLKSSLNSAFTISINMLAQQSLKVSKSTWTGLSNALHKYFTFNRDYKSTEPQELITLIVDHLKLIDKQRKMKFLEILSILIGISFSHNVCLVCYKLRRKQGSHIYQRDINCDEGINMLYRHIISSHFSSFFHPDNPLNQEDDIMEFFKSIKNILSKYASQVSSETKVYTNELQGFINADLRAYAREQAVVISSGEQLTDSQQLARFASEGIDFMSFKTETNLISQLKSDTNTFNGLLQPWIARFIDAVHKNGIPSHEAPQDISKYIDLLQNDEFKSQIKVILNFLAEWSAVFGGCIICIAKDNNEAVEIDYLSNNDFRYWMFMKHVINYHMKYSFLDIGGDEFKEAVLDLQIIRKELEMKFGDIFVSFRETCRAMEHKHNLNSIAAITALKAILLRRHSSDLSIRPTNMSELKNEEFEHFTLFLAKISQNRNGCILCFDFEEDIPFLADETAIYCDHIADVHFCINRPVACINQENGKLIKALKKYSTCLEKRFCMRFNQNKH